MGHTSGKNNLEHCAMPWHHLFRMHFIMEAIEIGFYCFFLGVGGADCFVTFMFGRSFTTTHTGFMDQAMPQQILLGIKFSTTLYTEIYCVFVVSIHVSIYLCWTCVQVNISWPTESEQNYHHICISIQYIIATSKFFPRNTHVLPMCSGSSRSNS